MTLIYFDMETTGLDPQEHEIAEIGACTEVEGEEFEVKVKFDLAKATEKALGMDWYDAETWEAEAVDLPEALACFDAWLREVEPKRWDRKLVGHFAAEFDKPFLLAACERVRRVFPADFRVRDTMQLAMWRLPRRRSYKLEDLYRDLIGKQIEGHRALSDARAAREVARELTKKNDNERGQQHGDEDAV